MLSLTQLHRALSCVSAVLLVASCERTVYAPGLTEQGFQEIKPGDEFADVVTRVGEPLMCYVYPPPGASPYVLPDGERHKRIEWSQVPDQVARVDVMVLLQYSAQANPRVNYMYCAVWMHAGKVYDKTWHRITE